MANKPLQSIKFPGLSDTYVVPQIDDTLSVEGRAADAKVTGDNIAGIKSDLNSVYDVVGMYRYHETVVNGTAPNAGNSYAVTISDFIPCGIGDTVSISTNRPVSASGNYYGYWFYGYDSEKNRIVTYDTDIYTNDEYIIDNANVKYIKFSLLEYDSSDEHVTLRKTDFDGYDVVVTNSTTDNVAEKTTALQTAFDDQGFFRFTNLIWINANVSNGIVSTGIKYRVSTKDILSVKTPFKISVADGFQIYVVYYDHDGAYISTSRADSEFTVLGGEYIRIIIKRKTEDTSETSDIDTFVAQLSKTEIVSEVYSAQRSLRDISGFSWIDGYAIHVSNGTPTITGSYSCTDFIPVTGDRLGQLVLMQGSIVGTGFYDVNKKYISGAISADFGASYQSYGSVSIPAGTAFVRFSALTAVKAKQIASWTGRLDLPTIYNSLPKDEIMHELNNARHVKGNIGTPLTILHFSDLHADVLALNRIINDASKYADVINEMICTGDIVANTAEQIESWWDENILTCVGNHETASYNSSTGYNWTALSMADRDAYYITPFESNWGITHTSGTSYYYKDYANAKVRMIVMDAMLYTDNGTEATEQTAWLENLLSDAITNNLHVLIAIHAPHGGASPVECSFSRYGQGTMPTYTDCNTPQAVIDVVGTKITAGLKFIGYLVGHTHQDNIWDAEGDKSQLMYCVTCAAVNNVDQWKNSDQYRDAQNDAYNIVTIDTTNMLVKIVRGGGANLDDHMRTRKAICINYSTGEVVGEIL